MLEENRVLLACDGAAALNGPRTGFGGWAFILVYKETERVMSGRGAYPQTNQSMELRAALEGLNSITRPCNVTLISDSEYLLKGLCGLNGEEAWMTNWISRKWRTSTGKKLVNLELWKELYRLKKVHTITPMWIRGHTPKYKRNQYHEYNARCDELAVAQAISLWQESVLTPA